MGRELVQLPLHVVEEGPEGRGIDGHPALLHACQHGQQGHLQPPEQLQQTVLFHALLEQLRHGQPQACGAGGRLAPALQFMAQHGAPAGRKTGPAVIVLFGIQQIGGHAQVDAIRRTSGPKLPAGSGRQQALEIGRHQGAGRGQPAGQFRHGACPLPFSQRAAVSPFHGKIGGLPVTVGPDQGHAGIPAVRQGRYVIQRGRGLLRHGIQQAHLAGGATAAGRLGQRQGSLFRGRLFPGCGPSVLPDAARIQEFLGQVGLGGLQAVQSGQLAPQGEKLELFREQGAGGGIQRAHAQVVQRDAGAGLAAQGGELPPDEHVFQMFLQLGLQFGRQQDEMVADVLKAGTNGKNLARGLGTDARHAGDVVAGITDKGLHVGPLAGRHAALRREVGLAHQLFFLGGRIPHIDIGAQALLQVLVAADDDDGMFPREARRQRSDAVVGLAALRDFKPQAQGPHHALDGVQLAYQVFGRGVTVGLVKGEYLVPEVGALAVLHEGEIAGALFAQDAQQHTADHHQGIGGKAVGALHVPVGKKAAIDEGRAIHEKDGLCGKPEALFQRHGNPGLRVSKKGKKPAGERPPSLRSFCPTRIL